MCSERRCRGLLVRRSTTPLAGAGAYPHAWGPARDARILPCPLASVWAAIRIASVSLDCCPGVWRRGACVRSCVCGCGGLVATWAGCYGMFVCHGGYPVGFLLCLMGGVGLFEGGVCCCLGWGGGGTLGWDLGCARGDSLWQY